MRWTTLSVIVVCTLACGDDSSPADDGTGGTSPGDSSSTSGGGIGSESNVDSTGGSSGAGSTSDTGSGGSSTGEPVADPLGWTDACIVMGSDLSVLHPRIECTAIDVPLDWDDPDGVTITVPAFRVRTEAEQRIGSFWELDGGPGGSGLNFFTDPVRVDAINAAGFDVVVHSHRGTLAPQLSCASLASSPACRAELEAIWGDGLRHFNTVQAAHDQAEIMRRAAVDEDGLMVVYGVSYGSYWGQFLLGLHPDIADAVILDSVLSAYTSVATQEAAVDERMLALLQECVDDPICGARVGFASAEAFAQAVIDAFDNGACGPTDKGLWADSQFRSGFGTLLNLHRARNYLPLLAALLVRCTPEDSQIVSDAINTIFTGVFSASPGTGSVAEQIAQARAAASRYGVSPALFGSGPLFSVVLATTMLPDDADIQLGANILATTGLPGAVQAGHEFFADLPNVEFDADFVPEVPVLILNATYDVQTPLPWAQTVAAQYGVEVTVVPDGQHATFSVGTGGRDLDGTGCLVPLVLDFAAAPQAPLNDVCVATLPAIDVNLTRPDLTALSIDAFGLADPWVLLD
ncbi:MAG: hypothetical protein JKY37_19800 [Nannocystaceae bacterium]|nr:hypothetical protein [Nannocystaceae bacterium]